MKSYYALCHGFYGEFVIEVEATSLDEANHILIYEKIKDFSDDEEFEFYDWISESLAILSELDIY